MQFSLFRIPVKIRLLFWVLSGLISFINSQNINYFVIWMSVIFVSVLLHELGHAVSARYFGQSVTIELNGMGGLTTRQKDRDIHWIQEFFIILAGPLMGFLLFFIAYFSLTTFEIPYPYLLQALRILAGVNFFWTLFNLLPLYPLDGGQLVKVILEAIFGIKGFKIALLLSSIIGIGTGMLCLFKGLFLPGAIFFLFGLENIRHWNQAKYMTVQDKDQDLQKLYLEGLSLLDNSQYDQALDIFEKIRKRTRRGILYLSSTAQYAKILGLRGEAALGFSLLLPYQNKLNREELTILHKLAFLNDDYALVEKIAGSCFGEYPDPKMAYTTALAAGCQGKISVTMGWLECCLREGMLLTVDHLDRKEFDKVRNTEAFHNFLQLISSDKKEVD